MFCIWLSVCVFSVYFLIYDFIFWFCIVYILISISYCLFTIQKAVSYTPTDAFIWPQDEKSPSK